jgi:hypothetical protein
VGIVKQIKRQITQLTPRLLYRYHYHRAMALTKATWGLICPYSIGDTYLVCALAEQLMLRQGGDQVVLLAAAGHEDVVNLFPGAITRMVTLDETHLRYFQDVRTRRPLRPGEPFVAHPRNHAAFSKALHRWTPRIPMLEQYQRFFQVPRDAPLAKPRLPQPLYDSARTRLRGLGLPEGRTVLLAPEAVTLTTLPHSFWQTLANSLQQAGWSVAVNDSGRGPALALENTCPVRFPLKEAIPIAELAGWVISFRSGLCDLISSAECRLSVIYPKMEHPWTPLIEFSLIDTGLSTNAEEIEIAPSDDPLEMARRIIG